MLTVNALAECKTLGFVACFHTPFLSKEVPICFVHIELGDCRLGISVSGLDIYRSHIVVVIERAV